MCSLECVLSMRLCAKMPCVHRVHQRLNHAVICICARADVHARTHTCTHAYGLQIIFKSNQLEIKTKITRTKWRSWMEKLRT